MGPRVQGLPPGPATHMRRTSQADTDDRPHTSQRQELGTGTGGSGRAWSDYAELADRVTVSDLRPVLQRASAAPKNTAGPRLPGGPSFGQVQRGKPSSVPPAVSPPHSLTGARERTCRDGRPFLWAPCRQNAQAVYPPRSPRTGVDALASGGCSTLHTGGVCPAPAVTSRAVRSYRTFSTLPDPLARRTGAIGGVFSVALSLARGRPVRVGVTHHRVLRCSDFPQHRAKTQPHAAAALLHP